MADMKISELDAAAALTGAEALEAVQAASSVQTTTGAVARLRPPAESLTTGGAPVTFSATGDHLVFVTSGGTAGVEIIDLAEPELDIDTWVNGALIGARVTFVFTAQTDPADIIKLTVNGSGEIYLKAPGPNEFNFSTLASFGIQFSYLGLCATFEWAGDSWLWDRAATNGNFDVEYAPNSPQIQGSPATAESPAGSAYLTGGYDSAGHSGGGVASVVGGTAGGDKKGGDAYLFGGDALDTGDGGDVYIQGGGSAGGSRGKVWMPSLPTSDPGIAGVLYTLAGVVKVSAG